MRSEAWTDSENDLIVADYFAMLADGVVTLIQIERNSPTSLNAETWDFNDLACCSIAKIRLISLNVTTPRSDLPPINFS